MSGFDRFVGIDWSGAEGRFPRGIAVAECDPDGSCRLVEPAEPRWSREAVLDRLTAASPGTLAGLDFAFSLPWPENGPLPAGLPVPEDVVALWAAIEARCRDEPHFYAGPVYRPDGGWLAPYMFTCLTGRATWVGPEYRRDRLRTTERAVPQAPAAAFHIVGAKTVGPGSFAGMRMLLALRARLGGSVAIWPFAEAGPDRLTVVEIYPGFFKRMAGNCPLVERLAHFDARLGGREPRDGHELDALVSAAAMRSAAAKPEAFAVPLDLMRREGWIFGVPVPTPPA